MQTPVCPVGGKSSRLHKLHSSQRQKLAWLAIGKTLFVACYKPLCSSDAGQTSQTDGSNGFVTEASTSMETAQQGPNCSTAELIQSNDDEDEHSTEPIQSNDDDEDDSIANAEQLLRNSCEQIIQKLQSSRDLNLAKGVIRFAKRVTSLTAARSMHSNLASALFSFGSSEVKKTGNGKKIRVQPNRKRKCGSGSRQVVSKGRPVQLQEPTSKRKRTHDLAKAVQTNTKSSKKSGSHTMKSKTKHMQRKK